MMKPICVDCKRFYRVKKNGFFFIEGKPKRNDAQPGTAEPDQWEPYKLWAGDLWECQGCGSQIVSGTGFQPISEHYLPDFEKKIKDFGADQLQVNDC